MDNSGSSPSPLRVVIVPWLAFGHMLPYLVLAERLASRGHPPRVLRLHAPQPRAPPAAAPRRGPARGSRCAPAAARRQPSRGRPVHQRRPRRPAGAPLEGLRRPRHALRGVHGHRVRRRAHEASLGHCRLLPPLGRRRRRPAQGPMRDAAIDRRCARCRAPLADGCRRSVRRNPTTLREGGQGAHLRRPGRVGYVPCPALALDEREVRARRHPELRRVGARVLPAGGNGPRHAGRTSRPSAAVTRRRPPCRRQQRISRARHGALAGREAARFGSVRGAGERSAAAPGAGARAGPRAGARRNTLPVGSQEAQRRGSPRRRRRHASSRFPRAHSRPGMVTTGWVPQMSILAHAAVGGFLTHCGRNSLIEGLLFGHPLVMLPIIGDQGPNARQMEARKVGLQVARDETDGWFDRHGVASAVQAVMVDGEARREFMAGAAKMQGVVADTERQERYMDEFVQHLRSTAADGKATTAVPTTS